MGDSMKYKKIESEINQKIIQENSVSKSVLEKAKMEMQNERVQLFLQGKLDPRKRSLVSTCLLPIMSVIIVIMAVFSLINTFKREPILRGTDLFAYNFTRLNRKESISIEEYNLKYKQNVKWVQEATCIGSYEYYSKNKTIILEEQYEFPDFKVNLFVTSLLMPIEFRDFDDLTNKFNLEDIVVYYDYIDGQFIARMSIMQYNYCFEISNMEIESAREFLLNFTKN